MTQIREVNWRILGIASTFAMSFFCSILFHSSFTLQKFSRVDSTFKSLSCLYPFQSSKSLKKKKKKSAYIDKVQKLLLARRNLSSQNFLHGLSQVQIERLGNRVHILVEEFPGPTELLLAVRKIAREACGAQFLYCVEKHTLIQLQNFKFG